MTNIDLTAIRYFYQLYLSNYVLAHGHGWSDRRTLISTSRPCFHEILRDAGRGVGGDVSEPRRVVAFGHDHDGVFHRALFSQVCDGLCDGERALTDGTIHAQHVRGRVD